MKRTAKALLSIFLVLSAFAPAAKAAGSESADTTGKKKEDAYKEFMEKKPETHKGFIKVHKLKAKVYFEFADSLMGREMLLGSTVTSISDNGDAIIGSKPKEPLHITFGKVGEKVNMILVSKDYITDPGNERLREAIDKNTAGAIFKSFKIDSYSPDSTSYICDVTDFFVGDEKAIRPFDEYGANMMDEVSRSQEYKSDRSYLGEVKAFESNVSVKSTLSYVYSLSRRGKDIAKDVPFSAEMTRSIILLDKESYKPRYTDSRIGIFPTGKMLFSSKEQKAKIIYYANRWRMEPSDTEAYRRGELVEPIKPIVFYIDPAFPEEWRPAIYEAVNQWQVPFEKIGFKNAIMAKDYPTDDEEFDPDNIKYSCIRYAPIGIQNAMGPSWVDPRSGEIINASVYVYHDVVKLINNWRFIQTSQTDESVRSGRLPKDVLEDALRYVITHEVGHCLGLMHNMSASATVPVDSLRSASYTGKYGTTHSIMDYARFNYVAQPGDAQRGVKLTPPQFGVYDLYAIKYSYTPIFDCKSYEEEAEVASKWLSEAQADPILRYGKQQFRTLDPRSQNEDLGDNAMRASEYGIANLKYILPKVNGWVVDDPDYSYRKDIYTGIIYQYLTYMQHVFAYIGGIYLWEKNDGDPVEAAYQCVPRQLQKDAFDFFCTQVRDLSWLDEPSLRKEMQLMGSPAKALASAMSDAIVAAPMKIMSTSPMADDKSRIYTPEECMEDLFVYVWEPTRKGRELNEVDRMLQRKFVAGIFDIAGIKYEGASNALAATGGVETPDFLKEYAAQNKDICFRSEDVSAVQGYSAPYMHFAGSPIYNHISLGYVQKVQKLLNRKKNTGSYEDRAHYQLLIHNIEKALK